MRVLVTGATGFVGQALVRHFAKIGCDTIAVARKCEDGPDSIRWDLSEEPPPTALPRRIDAIVHAAQSRNYRSFPADAREMFEVNTASTFKLLDYAAQAGASRFCLLSSGTVYEPFKRGLDEEAPLAPTGMLGSSKLAAEIIAAPFAQMFSVSILRLFTPYGAGQKYRLIPDLIGRVRDGIEVQLAADGQGARLAPIYVDDVCAIIAASLAEGWRGIKNVAAPQATTIREISEILGRLLGKRPNFKIGEGSDLHLAPPVRKLGTLIDLSKLVSLEDGLARTIAATREDH